MVSDAQPSVESAANVSKFSKLAGVLLLLMIVSFVLSDLIGLAIADPLVSATKYAPLGLLSGIFGWAAALLLLAQIRLSQQILNSVLMLVGLCLMLLVWSKGGGFALADALSRNAGLLTMIISVGFLKLVALPALEQDAKLPIGKEAFRNTLFSVAVFGSFINISAPVLIADRLTQRLPLDLFTCACLTRIFSGCSAWSPFFAGMAVILTYVPGVKLAAVMVGGLPFAVVGFLLVYVEGVTRYKDVVEKFRGFPMQVSSLWVPAVLALLVVTLSKLAPQLSILTTIALGGLIITVVVLVKRVGLSGAGKSLGAFVTQGLPRTANELTLFLCAGVLAVGLTGIVDLGLISLTLTDFDANTASVLLIIMVLIAMAGIHPVIQVAGFTPLLAIVSPDPELLAVTYLFAWSLGTCASPLSGTHIIMQGRYGIPCWKGAVNNWSFVVPMLLVAIGILHFVAKFNGL